MVELTQELIQELQKAISPQFLCDKCGGRIRPVLRTFATTTEIIRIRRCEKCDAKYITIESRKGQIDE